MGQDQEHNGKRARDHESDELETLSSHSPHSKIARAESFDSEGNSVAIEYGDVKNEASQGELSNSVADSPAAKGIQEDLLGFFEESEDLAMQGLDSLIKSFEDEIAAAAPVPAGLEMTSQDIDSQPVLGYLLEASDDELGLPPAFTSSSPEGSSGAGDMTAASVPISVGLTDVSVFPDGIPNYDSFEFELGGVSEGNSYSCGYNDSGDFVALGRLFDHCDGNYEAGDLSELQCQAGSLSGFVEKQKGRDVLR